MIHTKRVAISAVVLLAANATAFAQDAPQRTGPGTAVIDAARDTLGLTGEQIDQIREIRRQRPPRGQERDEYQAWRDDQKSKIQAVLSEDQKTKLAELEEARQKMRALAGAAILGLAETEREGRAAMFDRSRGGRDRRGFGASRSRSGPGPGWNRRGPGQGQPSRGFGRGGGRFAPRGRFNRGPSQGPRNRGGSGWNRD